MASTGWSANSRPYVFAPGTSSCVSTAWTPCIVSASEMSISTIRACACGLRTVWPQSIPAAKRSLAYANSPVTFGTASERRTTSPTRPSSSSVAPCNSLLLGIEEAHGEADGVEDLRVAGASAEVAGERLAQLVLARRRVALQQVGRRDDQAGSAKAALDGPGLGERLLHRVELPVLREPLDGHDVVVVGLRGKDEARADELPVEQHRARAALALLARVLR